MDRISYGVKNAKVALFFNILLLVLNFFSRRVFIDTLGNELVGLSTSVISFIGFLNLADAGISMAIVNALYLPLFKKDRAEIRDVVSIFGFLFKWVGIIILIAGLVMILLVPWIFAKDIAGGLDINLIYLTFGAFLTTTLLSYWVNYKQNLLTANQKGYVIARIFNWSVVGKILLQMALLLWAGAGYITWLGIEVLFGVIFSVWLGRVVRREYPWLDTSIRHGRAVLKKYAQVFRNMKRAFAHKVASEVAIRSDVIVISVMLSQSMVTFFTNYTLISDRVVRLVTGSLNNSYAGVGNLVAEGDRRKIKLVFAEFNAMYFWLGGIMAFGFYMLINPFILLWLPEGESVVFSNAFVAMLAAVLFISFVRQTARYFLNAYGLFQDVWAAWVEVVLNVVLSVGLCWQYGVIGVAIGTVASAGLMVFVWKPYFLYREGFRESSGEYWLTTLKYFLLLGALWTGMGWLFSLGWLPAMDSWGGWIVNAVVMTTLFTLVSGVVFYLCSSGMRDILRLWRDLFLRLLRKICRRPGCE